MWAKRRRIDSVSAPGPSLPGGLTATSKMSRKLVERSTMKYLIRIGLFGPLCLPVLVTLWRSGYPTQQPASQTPEHSEVENSSVAAALEPRSYWFYEGMKRLRDVHPKRTKFAVPFWIVIGVFLSRLTLGN
jgi:hypothetical protein